MTSEALQSIAIRVLLKVYVTADQSEGTSKTVAVTISKNGAAFGNPSAGATNATEIAVGWYYVDLSTTDTGTLGPLIVRGAATACDPAEVTFMVVNATNGGYTGIPDAAAGAAGGLLILGSNNTAAITIGALTTGALACTTITASGAVAFQSTFAVTTSTALGALSATTFSTSGTTTLNALTVTNNLLVSGTTIFTGAVSLGSTLGVTGATTLAAVNTGAIGTGSITITGTLGTSGTVTLAALTITGATTHTGATIHTGNFSMAAGLTITQSTGNGHGITVTGNGSGSGIRAIAGSTGHGLEIAGGSSSGNGISIGTTLGAGLSIQAVGDAGVYVSSDVDSALSLYGASGIFVQANGVGTDVITLNFAGSGGGKALRVAGDTLFTGDCTVTGATTFTGAITASNASNNIVGIAVKTGGITTGSFAAGAINAAAVADGAIDAATFAVGALDAVWSTTTRSLTDKSGFTISGTTTTLDALQTALNSAHGSGSWATATGFSTLNAAGVRAAVGLATANLDTQLGLVATQALLTDVATAAARLLTTLVLDGSVYQFTANALELGPSGSGLDASGMRAALGMASANLDIQLGNILSASTGGAGGALAFTITVTDGTDPLQNVQWGVYDGNTLIGFGLTNASGNATGSADAGTYTVALVKSGYSFAPLTRTVTGNQTGTLMNDLEMTAVALPSPSSDPAKGTVAGSVKTSDGSTKAGYEVRAELVLQNGKGPFWIGSLLITKPVITTTASDGSWSLDLYGNAGVTPEETQWRITCALGSLDILVTAVSGQTINTDS